MKRSITFTDFNPYHDVDPKLYRHGGDVFDWVDDRNKLISVAEMLGTKSYKLTINQQAQALGL